VTDYVRPELTNALCALPILVGSDINALTCTNTGRVTTRLFRPNGPSLNVATLHLRDHRITGHHCRPLSKPAGHPSRPLFRPSPSPLLPICRLSTSTPCQACLRCTFAAETTLATVSVSPAGTRTSWASTTFPVCQTGSSPHRTRQKAAAIPHTLLSRRRADRCAPRFCRRRGSLSRAYVFTNGRPEWLEELKDALQEDARGEGLDPSVHIGTRPGLAPGDGATA
jgi:hypothetical protein